MKIMVNVFLTIFALIAQVKTHYQPMGHFLFYFPIAPHSAVFTFMPVAERLVEKGHKVTVVSPYAYKGSSLPNLTEIVFNGGNLIKIAEEVADNPWERKFSTINNVKKFTDIFSKYVEIANLSLANPDIKSLWSPGSPKIDVVITTPFAANEISYYMAHRINATMVIWSSQQTPFLVYDNAIGQPHNPAYIGNILTTYRHPMSFLQRVGNTLITYSFHHLRNFLEVDPLEKVLDHHFPNDLRRQTLRELEKTVGLVLQFSHPLILDGLRPTAPNFVNIGMMNCREPKDLPDNLKKFVDESGDKGVILVSFGSVIKASNMPESKRQILLNVFKRLDQRIIWKWETEEMEDKPPNVLLLKWLPQQDLLGHPKLRLFVSHGGQSSCQESICHRKPMVIVPINIDQPANGLEAEVRGYGINIPLAEMTEETLYEAIRKVLDDPKYSIRAKEYGNLIMDDINKPLDRAIWWLEYAVRHPGMEHLRSPMHDLEWYQLGLLDVFGFIFLILFLLGLLVFKVCKFIIRALLRGKEKAD